MPFDPTKPANSSPLSSAEMRDQLNGLKALLDVLLPVGAVLGFLKSLAQVPALPGTWAECNGQAIADADSPLNGQFLPDLNGSQGGPPCFLRGGNTSGGTGGSETHSHVVDLNVNGGMAQSGADFGIFPPGSYNAAQESTLPTYYSVVWVVRIK